MASNARDVVLECIGPAKKASADDLLLKWISAEYRLFLKLERKVSLPKIQKEFNTVDDFINVAATVMNRRKSRAGHSLENYVEELLKSRNCPLIAKRGSKER